MLNLRNVFIVDGSRTPFLRADGTRGSFAAADLAVEAGKRLLLRQHFSPEAFDEVIMGCVAPSHDEANIARIISLRLGCGKQTPAWTVARNCASGMQALDNAAINIATGRSELVLAGGTEAMSHAPLILTPEMSAWFGKWARAKTITQKLSALKDLSPKAMQPIVGLLRGLRDPVVGYSMGQTAEQIAYEFGISRERMDRFALRSHERAARATDEGLFDEIVTLTDGKGNVYDHDNGVRRDSTLEKLGTLKPVFDREVGLITAANSAQITDGACMLILASEQAVKEHNLPVIGRIVDCEWSGVDPRTMGLGPVHACPPIMQRQGLKLEDIDYWEINEAFAAQVIGCMEAWKSEKYCKEVIGLDSAFGEIDEERLNVDGGSIAIGHPVGSSGARIVLHLLKTLHRTNTNRGMATICIGGGQGGAMLIEKV